MESEGMSMARYSAVMLISRGGEGGKVVFTEQGRFFPLTSGEVLHYQKRPTQGYGMMGVRYAFVYSWDDLPAIAKSHDTWRDAEPKERGEVIRQIALACEAASKAVILNNSWKPQNT